MSTRSMIAVMHGDKAKAVYCHWDGYVAHNGYILQTQYDSVKANKLVAMGDLSSLGVDIGEKHEFHSEDPEYLDIGGGVSCSKQCTFYGRDRGEDGTDYEVFHSLQTLLAEAESRWCEYVYVFKGNEWFYSKRTVVEQGEELVNTWTPLAFVSLALNTAEAV